MFASFMFREGGRGERQTSGFREWEMGREKRIGIGIVRLFPDPIH
jgi:hypothetical protein